MTSPRNCLRFTVLGCGSSPGVPRINGDWGNCDPQNPKNRRTRTSLLVERFNANGHHTTVVIDTGPDFRTQMINASVHSLDAAVYTHPHADHIHGIDDLRTYVVDNRRLMDVYANRFTRNRLYDAFGYCFETPAGSSYPPILSMHDIAAETPFTIDGAGGEIRFEPFRQIHGDIESLGFRIGNVVYCTDVSAFPDESLRYVRHADVLILGALQYRPHPSHFSLEQALEWIELFAPKRAILTHMHVPLDYETVLCETPANVEPGYDGLRFEIPL